eukprot:CAMPEP_0206384920 /NCGR_PEP_ID=MMETSP0294-20121207/14907_1 /ASSEMBLY_ACC=CAM_ASM_000327 /TAXON_ID=39354 /ORGANISM="Heterosigma akashiwo, Strain CCMP2393" /LENGTH=212 /DNA_ID=CAMNT_0053835413 /DNA_START=127 /DNA_END=762 /DNA_ORIENTATION=+
MGDMVAPKMQVGGLNRKTFLASTVALGASLGASVLPAFAYRPPPAPSKKEMLERLEGPPKSEEELAAEKAAKAEEKRARLERQRQLVKEQEEKKASGDEVKEAEIEADLRANYYFPTARKRYLPRVKACADEIDGVKALIEKQDWAAVDAFVAGPAEGARLPLQLYVSSLGGQGLSLEAGFLKTMREEAGAFGAALGALRAAAAARDRPRAL